MSVACKYLTPLKPTPNSKVFRNLHCKFKRLNSFSVSVNGHSENAYLRSLWALSCHSLRDHLTTAVGEFADFLTCDPNGCLVFRQCKNLSFFRVNSIFCFTKPIISQIAKLVGSVAVEILFILTLCSRDSA